MDNKNQNKIRIATVLFAISQVMGAGSSSDLQRTYVYKQGQAGNVVSAASQAGWPVMDHVSSAQAKSSATMEVHRLIKMAEAIARSLTKSADVTFTSLRNIAGYLRVYKNKSENPKFDEIAGIYNKIVRLEEISLTRGSLGVDFERNPKSPRVGSASTRAPSRATARAASEGGDSVDTASENFDSPRNRAPNNVVVRPTLKRKNSAPAALGTGATVVAEVEMPTVTTLANPVARPDFTGIAQRVVDLSKAVVVAPATRPTFVSPSELVKGASALPASIYAAFAKPAANSQSDEAASVAGSSDGATVPSKLTFKGAAGSILEALERARASKIRAGFGRNISYTGDTSKNGLKSGTKTTRGTTIAVPRGLDWSNVETVKKHGQMGKSVISAPWTETVTHVLDAQGTRNAGADALVADAHEATRARQEARTAEVRTAVNIVRDPSLPNLDVARSKFGTKGTMSRREIAARRGSSAAGSSAGSVASSDDVANLGEVK